MIILLPSAMCYVICLHYGVITNGVCVCVFLHSHRCTAPAYCCKFFNRRRIKTHFI